MCKKDAFLPEKPGHKAEILYISARPRYFWLSPVAFEKAG